MSVAIKTGLQSRDEQNVDLAALLELRQLLESAIQSLKSDIFNDELIEELLSGLKVHGPRMEMFFGNVLDHTFAEFSAGVQNETFSLSRRIKLFELVLLRQSNWTGRQKGPLSDGYRMLNKISRGTQTPHTPAGVTEAATNVAGKPPTQGQQIIYDQYVKGEGFEIKVSGASALLVGAVKEMIGNFFNGDSLNEALKANAAFLKVLNPLEENSTGSLEEKQEVNGNSAGVSDASPQTQREGSQDGKKM